MIRATTYGESDKIVTFLTRDLGKVSGIAKGALRSKRRFVASLEPFTHVCLGLRLRSQSDLCFVESSEILRAPRSTGRDLDRYAFSTYLVELVDCMVEGREAEPAIFDLTEETLARIDASNGSAPAPEWLRYFETRLLALSGLEPRLSACARCGASPADPGRSFHFNPRSGSVTCSRCAHASGLEISAAAIGAITSLRDRPLAETSPLPTAAATEVRVLLQTFIAHHVRRPLRSPALLREILREA